MKVNVRGKEQAKITPAVREYVEAKVYELEKLFSRSDAIVANVLCKVYDKYSLVEVTIPTKNIILRAESTGDTLYTAVDKAIEKIEKQLLRHKKKVNSIIRKREGIANYFSEQQGEPNEEIDVLRNIKNKAIELEIMNIEEAIVQMELLDHDFYVFINEENHKTTVAYIRDDGGYGIIETKNK